MYTFAIVVHIKKKTPIVKVSPTLSNAMGCSYWMLRVAENIGDLQCNRMIDKIGYLFYSM